MRSMGMIIPGQLLLGIVLWLTLVILAGMVLGWFWALRRLLAGQPLLPETPLVEGCQTPWGGGTVLLVFVVYVIGNVLAFEGYALATRDVATMKRVAGLAMPRGPAGPRSEPGKADQGAERASRERDHSGLNQHTQGPVTPAHSTETPSDAGSLSLTEMMFLQTAVNAVLLILMPLVVRTTSGA